MKTSEAQANLVAALIKAQSEFPAIAKEKEGQAGNRRFKYAPHDVILDHVRPVLLANGLLLTHAPDGHELVTRLDHKSGEWRETRTPVNKEHANLQSLGIEYTYLRRYAAQLMLGIITEDDTDGVNGKQKRSGVDNTDERNANGTGRGPGSITGTSGIEDLIPPERAAELDEMALDMIETWKNGNKPLVMSAFYGMKDNDEKVYVWKQLRTESKMRAELKANSPHLTKTKEPA